jgi:hypothetical protein
LPHGQLHPHSCPLPVVPTPRATNGACAACGDEPAGEFAAAGAFATAGEFAAAGLAAA